MQYTINVEIPDQYKKLNKTQVETIIHTLINNYFSSYVTIEFITDVKEDIWNKDYLSKTLG